MQRFQTPDKQRLKHLIIINTVTYNNTRNMYTEHTAVATGSQLAHAESVFMMTNHRNKPKLKLRIAHGNKNRF